MQLHLEAEADNLVLYDDLDRLVYDFDSPTQGEHEALACLVSTWNREMSRLCPWTTVGQDVIAAYHRRRAATVAHQERA